MITNFSSIRGGARKILHEGNVPLIRVNNGVLEYWNGGAWVGVGLKKVQRGLVTLSRMNNATVNITIEPVNMSKTFVNISYRGVAGGTSTSHPIGVRAVLTSSTNLEISYIHSSPGYTDIEVSWEVIEFY